MRGWLFVTLAGCSASGRLEMKAEAPLPVTDSGQGEGGGDGGGDGVVPDEDSGGAVPEDAPLEALGAARSDLVFTPAGGTFVGSVTVDIGTTAGGTVRYTTNGLAPSGSSDAWSAPLTVDAPTTICAFLPPDGEARCETYLPVEGEGIDFTSTLPLLVLHTYRAAPEYTDQPATPITVTLLEPGESGRTSLVGTATLSSRGGLEVRGSSSAGFPKRPYSLELWEGAGGLDRDEPLLGLPADGDWILYPPYAFDPSMMRNPFIYDTSNEIGRWAPHTRFVEVFVADEGETVGAEDYVGVYVLTERIERGSDRVDVQKLAATALAEPEVSGGYIFKCDRTGAGEYGFYAGDGGGVFSFGEPFVYVYPGEEIIKAEQASWLSDYIDDAGEAVVASDHVDPSSGLHYREIIDVDSFIDHHILNTFVKNPDAFRLSGYFHKDLEGLLVAGPIWDFDRAIGANYDDRSGDPKWWDATNYTSDNTYVFEFGWYAGLFEDEEFREAWWDRYRELLDGPLSVEEMNLRIDAYEAELSEAGPRDLARWPEYPARGSWSDEVALMRRWLEQRHAWISACVDRRPADPRDCTG